MHSRHLALTAALKVATGAGALFVALLPVVLRWRAPRPRPGVRPPAGATAGLTRCLRLFLDVAHLLHLAPSHYEGRRSRCQIRADGNDCRFVRNFPAGAALL